MTGAYKEEQELAGAYLRELLSLISDKSRAIQPGESGSGNAKSQESPEKIALVDIGWAGSGPLGVEYLLRKTSGLSWQIYTFLAGSSGAASPDRDSSQGFFFENVWRAIFSLSSTTGIFGSSMTCIKSTICIWNFCYLSFSQLPGV